jgi:hypothetical protein
MGRLRLIALGLSLLAGPAFGANPPPSDRILRTTRVATERSLQRSASMRANTPRTRTFEPAARTATSHWQIDPTRSSASAVFAGAKDL